MPARRGGDQTTNNLSAVAEPWVPPMGKRIPNITQRPRRVSNISEPKSFI